MKSLDEKYSRYELQTIRDEVWPDRGEYCQKCSTIIPAFEDLSEMDIESLRTLIVEGHMTEAMRTIQEHTGCPLRWAKIWVLHPYGGNAVSQQLTPPCPYCGSQLRTPSARQCPSCYRSWREEA